MPFERPRAATPIHICTRLSVSPRAPPCIRDNAYKRSLARRRRAPFVSSSLRATRELHTSRSEKREAEQGFRDCAANARLRRKYLRRVPLPPPPRLEDVRYSSHTLNIERLSSLPLGRKIQIFSTNKTTQYFHNNNSYQCEISKCVKRARKYRSNSRYA